MKRAVIFYSLTDNTKMAAEKISSALSADLIEVKTIKNMPKTFKKQILICGMQSTFGMKPAISGIPENISEYDEIVIGTPIWAGKAASPLNSVLADKVVADKVKAVFTFSGGGDNESCIEALNKAAPNIQHTVALADKNNELSKDNDNKINDFIEKIING